MRDCRKFLVDGEWVVPAGREVIDVIHTGDESVIGQVLAGTEDDAAQACAAASAAFPVWSVTSTAQRSELLANVGEALAARADEIGDVVATEVGMPHRLSRAIQAGLPIGNFRIYANMVKEFQFEQQVGHSLVVREPAGVVVAISPWNYPLHQLVAKTAAALAAGCTVVAKPSEVAPLSAFILAECIKEAGLPKGVFNMVTGYGPQVGEAMIRNPAVDMVSFTGSTAVGKRVAALAAEGVKRVHLELGGKSANIILPDADLQRAVPAGVANCFLNSGQTCTALTRMLVHESCREQAIELAKATAETFTVGDPMAEDTRLGPLASAAQRDRVREFIRKGIEQGATLVTGGAEAPEGLSKGFYVRPTVLADVKPHMTVAQEEIFGPVLCILTYRDEDEAVAIANDSKYGLAGAVWAGDVEHAKALARRIRTGAVDINGGAFNLLAPFGGFKQSGLGREMGTFGFEEFLEYKTLQV